MELLATVVAVFLMLLANELWWRRSKKPHGELSRKMVHLTVGSFVAFWPFFLSWNEIRLLSVAFLVVVCISKYFKVFQAIHSAQRPTWGEIFFAAAVGLVTFVTQNEWVYAAALLQMGLADGLAAVVGVNYGKGLRYTIFGHVKSVAGTLAFFVVSVGILLAFSHYSGTTLSLSFILSLSAVATLVENIALYGFDNLLVPMLVALSLASH